jgi:hypothetical protein
LRKRWRDYHGKAASDIFREAALFSDVEAAPLTDEQFAATHKLLAEYHRRLAKEAVLDVVQQYHSDLAQRLSDEAALIPRERPLWSAFTNANNKKRTIAGEPHRPPRDSAALISARTRQPLPRGGRIRIASGLAIFDPTALATDAFEHPHDAAASCVQTLPNELGVSVASEASAIFGRVRSDHCIGTQTIHATLNRTSQGNAPEKNNQILEKRSVA